MRQLWLFQMKIGFGRETKKPRGSKNAQLEVLFFFYIFFAFLLSPRLQAILCCLEITEVQFSLTDGNVMERGEGKETEAGENFFQSTVSISVLILGIVLYRLTCVFPICKWL